MYSKEVVKSVFKRAIIDLGFDYEKMSLEVKNNEMSDELTNGIMVVFIGCMSIVYSKDEPDDITLEYVFGIE